MSDVERLRVALAERYAVERELGAGGMATVYAARDLKHDRDVAIKVLHADLGAALGPDRFLSEIKTTARLQHPHILPLLDSGNADGQLYYVMPLLRGETLRARLERERQLPVEDAVRIAREVAGALSHAHAIGVVHRDIKPENILLQGGHALVADFGIALAVQQAGGQRVTQTGLSLGTPQYMSPEQAMGERTIDGRSDIYALGAMTYEMLIGEPPFTGPTVQAIVARLIADEPRELAPQRKAVPPHVEDAVLCALEKLPADRFATAGEFALALEGGSITSAATARRAAASRPLGVRLRPRPMVLATWALALPVAVAAGWGTSRLGGRGGASNDALTITSILAPSGGNFREQRSLALSPDGRQLAFVFSATDGSRMLWLRHLGRLEAEPIAGTSGADAPFWSPDGSSLAYFADGYLTVREENGDTRRLCPVSNTTGGSWGARDVILFGHRDGLSTVPASGGTCRLVVPRDSAVAVKGVFLPDGERFLYSRGRDLDMAAANLNGTLLGTLPIKSTEFAFVAPDYVVTQNAADRRALDAQRIDLSALELRGAALRVASNIRNSGGVLTFSISPSGALAFLPATIDRPYLEYDANGLLRDTVRVEGTWTVDVRSRGGAPLVALGGNVSGLWLYDLDTDRATRLSVRDTSVTSGFVLGATSPVFNARGTRLLYSVVRGSHCSLIERDLATDVERVVLRESVTGATSCAAPLDWSPDGRHLLVRRDTYLDFVSIDGTPPPPRIARPGNIWEGTIAPDGRTVAYSSDETGRAEVYVQVLPSGPSTRVSREGGRWPAWTHAGRRLTFMTPDGRIQEATFDGPGALGVPRTRFLVSFWRRSLFDDRGIGFAVVGDGERYIVRVSPSALAVAYVQHWPSLMRSADPAR